MPLFLKKLIFSKKLSFNLFFLKLTYIAQNQDSGLYPKKLGVIFFKAKLLNPKHGESCYSNIDTLYLKSLQ